MSLGRTLSGVLLLTLAVSPSAQAAEDAMTTGQIEERMAEWLAHPAEFGVRPKHLHLKHTYQAQLIGYGKMEIHLVEYTMPNGTNGRGFVNGSLTWSFLGDEGAMSDEDLFVAYCGWAWLFPALSDHKVQTEFTSSGEEATYLAQKKKEGFANIEVTNRYKIGDSEIVSFKAMKDGVQVQGSGSTEGDVVFPKSDPRFKLPSIYFLLGKELIESVR
jgi:hypothetical protein